MQPVEGMTAVGAFPNANAQLYRAASEGQIEGAKPSSWSRPAAQRKRNPRRVVQIMKNDTLGSHISGAKKMLTG